MKLNKTEGEISTCQDYVAKRIRPKAYVHIKFKPYGAKRARWYWAIKGRLSRFGPMYQRTTEEGDSVLKEHFREDGTLVCTTELLNLHYAKLEEK